MDDDERKARDQQLRSSIHTKLIESGEYDRLKEMLKQKLVDSGWREDLKQYTMNLIRTKGDEPLVPDACRSATGMYVPGVERQLERSDQSGSTHDARDALVPTCTARDS